MSETETPVEQEQEAPPAAPEQEIPGRCTRCGSRVVPSIARADGTMFHKHERQTSKGLRGRSPFLCGPVLTTWVYFLWLQWDNATTGQGGMLNHQVALRHPIEDIAQVRQLEHALAERLKTPTPTEGPTLVGASSGMRVRVINFNLLRAQ